MAQYKVPQDVEADDKLLGPFSFRQFVYLLIAGGLIALGVGLFQIFPILAIIPLPFVLFFAALALPLKKDQPMETYLAAIVSYYLKPHTRLWTPGQRDSTIEITVPKKVEESRTRDITGEEATHRLSFLANIVDTEGYAIKDAGMTPVRAELVAEANMTTDMFETAHFDNLETTIARDENERHAEVVREMQAAINEAEGVSAARPARVIRDSDGGIGGSISTEGVNVRAAAASVSTSAPAPRKPFVTKEDILNSSAVVGPYTPVVEKPVEKSNRVLQKPAEKVDATPLSHSIIELANNPDFSVATIAREANRINRKEEGEVFISLH